MTGSNKGADAQDTTCARDVMTVLLAMINGYRYFGDPDDAHVECLL
jgi:hypothetical protein